MIPHAGTMCLLDAVDCWDENSIRCHSTSHHNSENPLRENGKLASITLVEYAAQAAAVHAGLVDAGIGGTAKAFIGAIKSLKLHTQTVDDSIAVLNCSAQCSLQSAEGAIYELTVHGNDTLLMEARVVLVLAKG